MQKYVKFLPILALISVNLIPAIGVIFWGWSLTALMVLYWMESLIVGAFNIPKMALSLGTAGTKIRVIIFFCIHYGGFWLAHGFFLLVFLVPTIKENPDIGGQAVNTNIDIAFIPVLLLLVLSHLISFVMNFLRRDPSTRVYAQVQMFAPYGRVMLLHIMILGGATLAAKYSSSVWVLALLVVLKLVLDLGAHILFNSAYHRDVERSTDSLFGQG